MTDPVVVDVRGSVLFVGPHRADQDKFFHMENPVANTRSAIASSSRGLVLARRTALASRYGSVGLGQHTSTERSRLQSGPARTLLE